MNAFPFRNGQVYCESVPLQEIASAVGTPAYVYSRAALQESARACTAAFGDYPVQVCFAVKSNGCLAVLKTLFAQGLGADIVSIGEMERALRAGAPPGKLVFSGVGKQRAEIEAALRQGILTFNVESLDEIQDIDEVAQSLGRRARISLRINPNIDVDTNPHISTGLYTTKFGIAEADKEKCLARLGHARNCDLVGIACHIGSQITEMTPFREAARRMVQLARELKTGGFPIEMIDLGGGLGIDYQNQTDPPFAQYAQALLSEVRATGLKLLVEPGRALVGNAGVLITRVIRLKSTPQKTFVVVDAAMNDLIRPCLYDAYHAIEPASRTDRARDTVVDVVGPVCETADFLARDCRLPAVAKDELLVVRGCGAYAATMASNYNSRPRAPEILVDHDRFGVARRRESLPQLWEGETLDP